MKKVLIIETEDAVRTSIRELLEANNFTVFSASEGKEGFKLAEKIIPDIIICNITMSKIDGFEEISKLKSKPAFNHTPFIFLTAKAEITDLRFGTERDTYDYITKPFNETSQVNYEFYPRAPVTHDGYRRSQKSRLSFTQATLS